MEFLEGIEPRGYQQEIFKTCLEKNCLVVLSTGLGKTLIALMVAIERLKAFPKEKVIFVAPTRPLAEQHLKYFQKHLPELFAELTIFTGKVEPKERKRLWQNADIIFSTPQCISHDVEKGLYDLSQVCLLIEDEAHRCIRNYSYTYLSKKYLEQANHIRIIGLTASPGSEKAKIKEICKNLSIEEVELRTRESQGVKEYVQELEFNRIDVDFPREFLEIKVSLMKLFDGYVDELKNRRLLFTYPSKSALIELQRKLIGSRISGHKNFNSIMGSVACASAIKIQHAIELLETQTISGFNKYLKGLLDQAQKKKTKSVQKLAARPEFTFAYLRSESFLKQEIEHPKVNILKEIIEKELSQNKKTKILIFTQFRDTASIINKNLQKIEGINSRIFVGQTIKEGIEGKAGLSQKDQRKVIEEFSEGKINVLCATSIGEEGLDIPEVNAVIFYEPVPSAIRTIQRAGRTARLIKGKLIILMTKKTRDESYYYVSRAKEKKMHTAIHDIREDMKENNKKYLSEKQKTL